MPQFPIYVTAVDKVTATIDRINKKLAAINAPTDRLRKSFATLGQVSGMNKLGASFGRLASFALNAFRSITRIIAPLGIITGALSVAGMGELVRKWADFGTHLGNTANRVGMTSDQLHAFEGSARLAGASAESLDSGLTHLRDAMTDAIGGRNPEALSYLNLLKINFRDVHNHARDVVSVLPELADKIASIKDPSLQARMAMVFLGGAAEELLPWIKRASAGIAEYVELARKYGVMNDQDTAAADRLRLAQAKVNLAIDGFVNRLSAKLEPILSPLLTKFADWVGTSQDAKDAIAALGSGVNNLAEWLNGVRWKEVGKGIKDFVKGANDAAQAVGGWGRAVEILFGLWMGAKFLRVMANIATMTMALRALGGGSAFAGAAASGVGGGGLMAALGIGGLMSGAVIGGKYGLDYLAHRLGLPTDDEAAAQFRGSETFRGSGAGVNNLPPHDRRSWIQRQNDRLFNRGGARGPQAPLSFYAARAALMPSTVARYFAARGIDPEIARGIAAGSYAESRDDPNSVNPTSGAYGIGQHLGSRKDELFRRYGPHPTADQQLEFLNWELHGGDPGGAAVLKARNANEALNAYVRRFMRPAAGVETMGDIARGQAILPSISALAPPMQLDKGAFTGAVGSAGRSGTLDVTVKHVNAPKGSSISAISRGDAVNGPPRIERAMPDFQSA